MKLSVVINCDTRPQNDVAEKMFSGTVNSDFLLDGIINKKRFFAGFDIELIVYVDEHLPIPPEILHGMRMIADTVVARKHTTENSFNDYNYVRALSMASGDIVVHFDQDTAAFTSSPEPIEELITLLNHHKFISYPSHWSPKPVIDESFGHRTWASTRFFMCKRETLQLDNLRKCIEEPEWAYATYGDSPRRLNWTEHFLTLMNNDSCYYPPIDLERYAIFSWGSYESGILNMLNHNIYSDIKNWILKVGGINYPVDVNI